MNIPLETAGGVEAVVLKNGPGKRNGFGTARWDRRYGRGAGNSDEDMRINEDLCFDTISMIAS